MKKIVCFAAFAAIVLGSCSKEQDIQNKGSENTSEIAPIYSLYAELPTKTTYAFGDASFAWAEDELISVGTESGYKNFTCKDVNTGHFEGSVEPAGIAVTPVQNAIFTSATNYQVKFPTEYTDYVPGVTNALMIGAPIAGGSYFFYNAGGLIQVTYNNVPATVNKLVMTTSNNITGTASLTAAPTSETKIDIASSSLADAGKTVTLTLSEAPVAGSSLSFFVPVPTGNLGSLAIELQNSEGTRIEGSNKSLTGGSLTITRGQVLALPAIQLVSSTSIGNDDNTTAWWTAFSPDFAIQKGKRLHLKFINYTSDYVEDTWKTWFNWLLVLTNGVTRNDTANGYTEYLAMRADKYGWGTKYNAGVDCFLRKSSSSFDYAKDFRDEMNGATIDMTIDFNGDTIFILATYTSTTNIVYTRHLYISGFGEIDSVTAFLTCEKSHLSLTNAYYDSTRGNVRPDALEVNGIPETITQNVTMAKLVEKGNDIEAKVTWPDGTKTYVDYSDVALSGHESAGDGLTLTATYGKKIYGNNVEGPAYNKTFAKTVNVEADYIESIDASVNAVVYGASDLVSLSQESVKVLANWASGYTSQLPSSDYSVVFSGGYWGDTFRANDTSSIATVTYTGANGKGASLVCTADLKIETVSISETGFGSTTTSFAWNWENPWEVPNGKSATIALTCATDGTVNGALAEGNNNWHTPQIYIKNQGKDQELYRARMDYTIYDIPDSWKAYGWGGAYVNGGNINWANYQSANLDNSKVYITVSNNNGIAWVTFFWQYYKDSSRSELIDSDNTVFVNYGKLPITAGESIYIIPASEYCEVTFIR